MGRQATMSVLGLYNWDNTLFDLMELPEGLDKDVVVGNILQETAELEVLYPDPNFMKQSICLWSKKEVEVWTRLYETTQYEYNPIENYNRMEEGSKEDSDSMSGSGNSTRSANETRSSQGTSETFQAGYDSVPSGQSDGLVKTQKSTANTSGSVADQDIVNHSQSENRTGESEYTVHAHGNIGVTTTQKLISEERNIAKMNLYDIIINEFRDRFCVMVW